MLRLALTLAFLALALPLAAPRAAAQDLLAPNPEIEAVIGNQFEAFRSGDIAGAWQYASPNIQQFFGNPDTFARMVEEGYPMVWQPGTVNFIDLQAFAGVIVQRVEVIDATGTAHYLGYQMIETEDGWRINAVQVLRAPEATA